MKPARWESFSPLRAISGSPSVSMAETGFAGGSGEVRDGHWGGAGGTMPGGEGKGPAEWEGTEGSMAGSRCPPRPHCLPAKLGTTAAASCFAQPHHRQVAPTPRGWAAQLQREVPGRARGWLPSGNATAPGHGLYGARAGSTSSSPRSAQRSPLVPGVSKEGMARHAFPSPV